MKIEAILDEMKFKDEWVNHQHIINQLSKRLKVVILEMDSESECGKACMEVITKGLEYAKLAWDHTMDDFKDVATILDSINGICSLIYFG